MENNFTLKKYANIDDLMLASFHADDQSITIEDMKGSTMGGLDQDEKEVEFSYEEQKEGIEAQGIWGWIDKDKIIHYWIGKELPIEELIHFFAHEIGHRTGVADEDDFKEEMRAEGYGTTATLAYQFAFEIKEDSFPM